MHDVYTLIWCNGEPNERYLESIERVFQDREDAEDYAAQRGFPIKLVNPRWNKPSTVCLFVRSAEDVKDSTYHPNACMRLEQHAVV